MGNNGLYFSMDNLPERYRVQVAQKLAGEQSKQSRGNTQSKPPKAVEVPSRTNKVHSKGKHKRMGAPIRMSKGGNGPNKTEEQFNRDVMLGKGKYEAVTLNLPGGSKYTADWMLSDEDGIYLIEVKGSYKLPTHGRSVLAFKTACSLFPMFTFLFAELGKDGKTWNIGIYRDGREVRAVRGTARELHEIKE